MTLIELKGMDQYTYVDTDGIIKMLDFDADYDYDGFYDGYSVSETNVIAIPWLHDYKRWLFRVNYCSNPTESWDDLPF
jgi:hypothetical protein